MNLTAADLESFAKLRILPELLERAGVVRVTDREARDEYGIRGGGDMAGIAFPYFEPSSMANGRRRWYSRIRRDHPELEDGKEKKKYVAPYQDRRHFYFPPTPDLFTDSNVPIALVEGEKSVLALIAWSERTGRKILPLAIGGCWGWRGKIGIKETATGERVPEHGAVGDLNICRQGRTTYVLFDSNSSSNDKVQAARAQLVGQLKKQGTQVVVLDLPAGDGINGPDDFICVRGDEAMQRIFDGWQEGSRLLNDVEEYIRRFAVLTPEQAAILAVYSIHTHLIETSRFTPYIQVWSPVMQSGKTRVLEVLRLFVCKPWMTERVSAAALVRKIAKSRPTLLLDEGDTAFAADKEYSETLRGILNAGFQKGGCAHVCVKKNGDWDVQEFHVFCPKIISGIGMDKLPSTVRDRSIPIEMKRRAPGETVEDFDAEDEIEASRPIREKIETWANQNCSRLKAWPKPERLLGVSDRQRDICNPLLKIADLVGGGWLPKLADALTKVLGAREDDESLGIRLLSDIREVFNRTEAEKLPSAELVAYLAEVQTSPWAEFNHGKPITPNRLARLLKPFRIFPKVIRIGEKTPSGYLRDSFSDAFSRYLPLYCRNSHMEAQHPQPASIDAVKTHFSKGQREGCVEDPKVEESPVSTLVVEDVEDQNGGKRLGEEKTAPIYEDLELPCAMHGSHRLWWIRIAADGGEMVCGKCERKGESH